MITAGQQRALEALQLRENGLTFAAIGKLLGGVCPERAYQLVAKGRRIKGNGHASR